jgi:hypothetical protein
MMLKWTECFSSNSIIDFLNHSKVMSMNKIYITQSKNRVLSRLKFLDPHERSYIENLAKFQDRDADVTWILDTHNNIFDNLALIFDFDNVQITHT